VVAVSKYVDKLDDATPVFAVIRALAIVEASFPNKPAVTNVVFRLALHEPQFEEQSL